MNLTGDGISFISFTYLAFLSAAALVRYLCPKKACAPVLLLISLLFYATWNPASLLLLILTIVSTYWAGLYLGRTGPGARKPVLILTLCFNIGMLFVFKYRGMFFLGAGGSLIDRFVPIGISFYTLQALGYVIDTYRYGKNNCRIERVERNNNSRADDKINPAAEKFHPAVEVGSERISDPKEQKCNSFQEGSGHTPGAPKTEKTQTCKHRKKVNVLRGIAPERNFINYALFVSFFPGILSGPIERAGNMLPQYRKPGRFDYENLRNGLMIMAWGYFMKLVLADRIAIVVDAVYADPDSFRGTIAVLATLLYSMQIYCDFAGYSAIAIGSARVLGFRVMQNFEAPYLSGSIAEFWRRWHISLSTWFRDYLYIPLGGNRKGTVRKFVNVLIVFAVSGLWHGADFSFLLWGIIHGLYQVLGYLLKPLRDGAVKLLRINRKSRAHIVLKAIIVYLLASFAWIFFRADSIGSAVHMVRCLRGIQPWKLGDGTLTSLGLDTMNWVLLACCLAFLLFRDILVYRGISLRVQIQKQNIVIRWILYLAFIMLILICGIWGPGYNASSFIYSQF